MKIVIREKAADDLENIHSWIAENNPRAATQIVGRIRDRIARLGTPGLAHMGRPGLVPGSRELIEAPYIVIYTVDEARDELTVIAIVHGARQRPR